MAEAIQHITNFANEVSMVPSILAGFTASMPVWITAVIGVNVACGIATLVIKIFVR